MTWQSIIFWQNSFNVNSLYLIGFFPTAPDLAHFVCNTADGKDKCTGWAEAAAQSRQIQLIRASLAPRAASHQQQAKRNHQLIAGGGANKKQADEKQWHNWEQTRASSPFSLCESDKQAESMALEPEFLLSETHTRMYTSELELAREGEMPFACFATKCSFARYWSSDLLLWSWFAKHWTPPPAGRLCASESTICPQGCPIYGLADDRLVASHIERDWAWDTTLALFAFALTQSELHCPNALHDLYFDCA